jgi:excisionase family DNA binding protein
MNHRAEGRGVRGGRTVAQGGQIYHVSPEGAAYGDLTVESTFHRRPELQPKALSIEQVGRVSGVGKTKLYELIAAGTLKSRKVGRRRLVLLTDLNEFLQSLPTE